MCCENKLIETVLIRGQLLNGTIRSECLTDQGQIEGFGYELLSEVELSPEISTRIDKLFVHPIYGPILSTCLQHGDLMMVGSLSDLICRATDHQYASVTDQDGMILPDQVTDLDLLIGIEFDNDNGSALVEGLNDTCFSLGVEIADQAKRTDKPKIVGYYNKRRLFEVGSGITSMKSIKAYENLALGHDSGYFSVLTRWEDVNAAAYQLSTETTGLLFCKRGNKFYYHAVSINPTESDEVTWNRNSLFTIDNMVRMLINARSKEDVELCINFYAVMLRTPLRILKSMESHRLDTTSIHNLMGWEISSELKEFLQSNIEISGPLFDWGLRAVYKRLTYHEIIYHLGGVLLGRCKGSDDLVKKRSRVIQKNEHTNAEYFIRAINADSALALDVLFASGIFAMYGGYNIYRHLGRGRYSGRVLYSHDRKGESRKNSDLIRDNLKHVNDLLRIIRTNDINEILAIVFILGLGLKLSEINNICFHLGFPGNHQSMHANYGIPIKNNTLFDAPGINLPTERANTFIKRERILHLARAIDQVIWPQDNLVKPVQVKRIANMTLSYEKTEAISQIIFKYRDHA